MTRPLQSRLAAVRERVDQIARSAGRPPGSVRILAVTKSASLETALELCKAGQADFGESRLAELRAKRGAFLERGLDVRWHFVGQIQRNKLARIVAEADVLHSVDRAQVLEEVERAAAAAGRRARVYLQVRTSADPAGSQRAGFEPAALAEAVALAARLAHVELAGLMTLGPRPTGEPALDEHRAAQAFGLLASLRESLPAQAFAGGRAELSMGMSDDLEQAIRAGADVVRIGRALVGECEARDVNGAEWAR